MPSITLTTTNAQATRLAAAIGRYYGLTVANTMTPRSATGAEVNQWIKEQCEKLVLNTERAAAAAAVVEPTPLDITVT